MADRFDSPMDVGAEEAGLSGFGQLATALAFALVTLALLNAHALGAWADTLAPGIRSARVGEIAHGLADRMAARGLDRPRAVLSAEWNKAKAARWPDQQAPE